ncbi:MAG: hypothetical protein WD406_01785 [Pseudohongiellaceae bacterium]
MHTNSNSKKGITSIMGESCLPVLLVVGLSSALASVTSQADVPHIFADGTPAIAGEVNANFESLDLRLGTIESLTLEDRLSALESLDPPQLTVDCDSDADALQAAIDTATPLGLSIQVSGSCNAIEIFNKRNLFIDGGDKSSTTITATDRAALDIGLSQGVFIDNLTAVGSDDDPAIIVGASTALISDVTAINGPNGDGTVSVWSNGFAVFGGDTVIGSADGSDPVALQISERGSVIFEQGTVSIKGTTAIAMEQQSLLDQDPGSAANTLSIEGDLSIENLSSFEISNGSVLGNIFIRTGSQFLASTEADYSISIDGEVDSAGGGATFTMDTRRGGAAELTGIFRTNFAGGAAFYGPGTVVAPELILVGLSSRVFILGGVVVGNGEVYPAFTVRHLSVVLSLTALDLEQITCVGTVVVQQVTPDVLDICS